MPKYVAFLRAINVGGRVVKMDELKKICSLPGIKNITTYIQSGNVLFESSKPAGTLKKDLETALKKALGYEVGTFVLSEKDILHLIEQNPFRSSMKNMNLYVTLMDDEPGENEISLLEKFKAKEEQLRIIGTTAFLLCLPHTYGRSKLSNSSLEKKLKVNATTRNWTTLNAVIGH